MKAINIERPVLVGHSLAGEELSSIGSRFPAKVSGLIYLDAATGFAFYDPAHPSIEIEMNDIKSRIDEIELLPKDRYHIMYPYMARKGRLGQRMMKQTAGVQANLDFSDEADAIRKLRVSMGIVPLLYAAFANSAVSDGAATWRLGERLV